MLGRHRAGRARRTGERLAGRDLQVVANRFEQVRAEVGTGGAEGADEVEAVDDDRAGPRRGDPRGASLGPFEELLGEPVQPGGDGAHREIERHGDRRRFEIAPGDQDDDISITGVEVPEVIGDPVGERRHPPADPAELALLEPPLLADDTRRQPRNHGRADSFQDRKWRREVYAVANTSPTWVDATSAPSRSLR